MSYAGKYNRVITIQTPIKTKQDTGELKITSWDNVVVDLPAWQKMESSQGSEAFESNQRVASNQIQFIVRYPHSFAITEVMRVLFESNYYGIVNAHETGVQKRTEFTITCETKDNN